ncbi:hypothetical protein BU16DRAFT_554447 [Lophium mytilinum]|uniref:BHLH domain-containing protein n=1 Tax=Lophium mytilinum TaxID=390894 RepID=A0A6A6RDB1_9PEZI|nr:hypothetical protein BU16DRAFT_554447 [Lophium mytilinum]
MDSNTPDYGLDDGLELERVAVGPYCVFDDFKPPPLSPRSRPQNSSPSNANKAKMDESILSNEYPFNSTLRAPWLVTSGEDIPLIAASPDDFARGDWNEWMQWNPTQNQAQQDAKLSQGPVPYPKSSQSAQMAALYNRRQNSQLRNTSLELSPGNTSPSQLMQPDTLPYSFSGTTDSTPAFQFQGAMSSPSDGGPTPNGFLPTPPIGWDQQQGDNPIFSPINFEQQSALRNMAMPPRSTPSLHHSPSSAGNVHSSPDSIHSSPEPAQSGSSKKRKSSSEEESEESKQDRQPPIKKTAHNMIEKRYRTNLNDKIAALRDSVPSLRIMSRGNGTGEEEDDPEDLEGLTPAHKLNKATVLSKATEYIRHLEKRNKRLADELQACKARLDNMEKIAMSGPPMGMSNVAIHTPDGMQYHHDPFDHMQRRTPASGPPQGMIPVPESIANLHRGMANQPHYAPQGGYPTYSNAPQRPGVPGQPIVNGRRGNGMMGKLMVGSLAGLMILEGFSEREQSSEQPAGRGLFAIPLDIISFFSPQVSVGGVSAQSGVLPMFKLLLVLGAVFYIIAPLFDSKPKSHKKKLSPTITLSPAPSLASPVEVRRSAWLTAIQTVWVPRHSFLLELAALGLKTLKLSTRRVIGEKWYAVITKTSIEAEAARVKAWEIALDAQLTGGDAEINLSRLVLTLIASGTLPDTPARLMLKSLHIRVLLQELANIGYGHWYKFPDVSAKLARRYWNAARDEHRIASCTPKDRCQVEPLPPHLAALIERECDEVFVDSIIQRAYNLAWNKPSADNTTVDESMDSVVEDFAISSPLDALAAWWSSFTLGKTLADSLGSGDSVLTEKVESGLELALRIAPPTSAAQLRALVAKAVLSDSDRADRVEAAFQALPHPPSPTTLDIVTSPRAVLMNLVGNAPIATDLHKALTLAKCLTLIESPHEESRLRATFVVDNSHLPGSKLSLLSFVAAYKVVQRFMQDEDLLSGGRQGLERMTSSMRVWIGHEAGRAHKLSAKTKGKIVERCLEVSKRLVGMSGAADNIDAGYVSQSDSSNDVEVEVRS